MASIAHMYIDFSTVSLYKLCPRKFSFEHIHKLVQKDSVAPDDSEQGFFKGDIIHRCIDAVYQGQDWEELFESLVPAKCKMATMAQSRSGSKLHIKTLIQRYLDHYNVPNHEEFKVIATEQKLEMPVTEWLTYGGTIDKIAITPDEKVFLIDHKTSSSLSTFMVPTVRVSDQFTGYLALAQAHGKDTQELVVDGISTAKKSLDSGEGLFWRESTIRTAEQIEEWRSELIGVCSRLKWDIENSSFATNRPGACNQYFKKCPYYDVCAMGGSAQSNYIKNNYEQTTEPWPGFRITWKEE